MVYLEEFKFMTKDEEDGFLMDFPRTCFDSYYPLRTFPYEKALNTFKFDDITILYGTNGSGKSTLLNIIAEKLELRRETSYNKTYFFDPFLNACWESLTIHSEEEKRDFHSVSRIITSDDVFNHILKVRKRNEDLDFRRQLIFDNKSHFNSMGIWEGPKGISADNPKSLDEFINYYKMTKMSASQYVRRKIGVDERTYSNGENGFKYFTDAIQPNGLYLLDEPENSLSPELQIELLQFLQAMARCYKCQFIISTHSPFLLSIPHARIYNLDSTPIETCRWTELPNVRVYYEFFKHHQDEFAPALKQV